MEKLAVMQVILYKNQLCMFGGYNVDKEHKLDEFKMSLPINRNDTAPIWKKKPKEITNGCQ